MEPPSSAWSPALTRRLRVLLHTAPLHELRRRFARGEEALRHYDAAALAARAMDAILERAGLDEEADTEAVLCALTPLLKAMDALAGAAPDPARHRAATERVLAGLRSGRDGRQPFRAEYIDLDESGRAHRRVLEFRLLTEAHHPSGRTVLRLSSEAVGLSLRLLDVDIEDAQAATEALVRSQLDRGRFEEAIQSARQARLQSLRFRQKVTRVARETRRDVERMDWARDVPALIEEALDHVGRRLESERAILEAAEERLERCDDGESRRAVARIAELIRDFRVRHVELHEELMKLRGVFLDAQALQSFTPAPPAPLPELRGEVLEPLLAMPRAAAQAALDAGVPALLGAGAPGLPRLSTQVSWLLMPRRAAAAEAVPAPGVRAAELADRPPRFPPSARRLVDTWLAELSAPTPLSSLLAEARARGADDSTLELLALTALQHFAPDSDAAGAERGPRLRARRLETPLTDPAFSGDDLELTPEVP